MVNAITERLQAWRAGNASAEAALAPEVYAEMRRIAGRLMREQAPAHILQPTALANEAWIKLAGSDGDIQDRAHFYAVAAKAMRQILIDHARGLARKKRSGGQRVSLTLANGEQLPADEQLLQLDDELVKLETTAPRAARATELHYFGGMSQAEIGSVLGVSLATVERDIRFARAWLGEQMQ